MIYNLIVLNTESGLNLATIKLAETGINEQNGILMSGIVKAIESFLEELEFGEIKTFETHEKKVLVYHHGIILTALICDHQDNETIYFPKLKYITEQFNNACDWSKWCGEIDIFNKQIELTKKIFKLSLDEILSLLFKTLKIVLELFPEILGFKIKHKNMLISYFFKKIEDYELFSLFSGEFFKNIEDHIIEFENIVSKSSNELEFSYFNYERFSLLIMHFLENISILLFLPGNFETYIELKRYLNEIKRISGF